MIDRYLGRLQSWLQGVPNKHRPWWVVRIGNLISDARYWAWRRRGGTHEWIAASDNTGGYTRIRLIENTSGNTTHYVFEDLP